MVNMDRIDHISAYCDGWCERCAFTLRCSAYAVRVATAMCDGDVDAAIELAVAAPAQPEGRSSRHVLPDIEPPTEAEIHEVEREHHARDERVDELPITTLAWKVMMLSRSSLGTHSERWRASSPLLANALDTAAWDCFFIPVKLRRALSGRDEFLRGNGFDDHPVQNDWNGSAKVALISIVRSEEAWTAIAGISRDPDAAEIAAQLRELRVEVERIFPDAWRFVRPGFDTVPLGDSR
jgi:hypothetical protein